MLISPFKTLTSDQLPLIVLLHSGDTTVKAGYWRVANTSETLLTCRYANKYSAVTGFHLVFWCLDANLKSSYQLYLNNHLLRTFHL